MEKLFISILNMSISASYLILAVLFVRFVLRKAPKSMRCFLWLLVGIRLLFPFSIESVFSLIPDTQVADEYVYKMTPPAMDTGNKMTEIKTPVSQPATNFSASSEGLKPDNTLTAILIGTRLWLSGMVLMVGYMTVSWFRLRSRVRTAIPADFTPEDGYSIKYYLSDTIETPFLFGLFRPRIYIPSHISDEELPYVLLHERTHRKRRDYLIKPLGFLLLSVYWFNPCVWIAYIMLCKDIELICDEKVVQELGAQCKKAYSQALLACAVNRRMISACPVAFGEVSVKARVKNVLNYKKPAFWVLVAAVSACIIVPVCFMTQKKADESENEESVNAGDIAGEYYMTALPQDRYLSVPELSLGPDGKFTFSYDVLSSYLPYGNYELEDDVLTAVTDDGKYHYQFTLAKNGSLAFDAEQSSDVTMTGGRTALVENGSVFVRDSTFYTKYYTEILLAETESLLEESRQEMYQGTTKTVQELEELQKQLLTGEEYLKKQLKELETLQSNQEEALQEANLQELTRKAQSVARQLEEERAAIRSMLERVEADQTAYVTIEQWAQAFCDRDGATIVRLADEKAEQSLVDRDILTHGFDGGKDYVSFGWSSPWPWGGNYGEDVTECNYRIMSVTDRSAEILYYAWVSDPHVTVWRELLTYKTENDKCVINSETLQFLDYICTSEEFYQAYPGGVIAGTMMDYYTLNGAGEALNNNAKKNSNWYGKLFEPASSAVCLLNLLKNPNKVGTSVKTSTDADQCTVTITFYEDGSSVDVTMIQPYGADGIWIPYTSSALEETQSEFYSQDTASLAPCIVTNQNVEDMIAEDAEKLEALFPDHHEYASSSRFPKSVDLNGDGIEEKIELTNLRYNGGDGGYALTVTDTKTGNVIPLPDGYTEEEGFPIRAVCVTPEGEESRLLVQLGEEKRSQTVATLMRDALISIYERNHMYSEVKDAILNRSIKVISADALSGCNIVTYDNEENPVLLLKTYVSGFGGHADTLGYVITELRLRKDNTWASMHYFLLDSCDDVSMRQQSVESSGIAESGNGNGFMPFNHSMDIDIIQLTPEGN